ncbi:hypothetical protein GH740_05010 [Microbacterium sp. SYP-A9085]|uniref:hypothetical protein n=1 Tax=Microbacterium sp. SYP-A9085 TaxID=2664454 RepID=UPI00129B6226|nr:hypothetical protein [Microbacterium sp. SYP-A9085]MRH28675.1 hypothetical protein [Microbacterium sp. SYP-A9085]
MRSDRALHSIALWGLIAVSVFQAASAIAGGVALLVTGGLGMPASMLASAPFRSFVAPALILLVVVGGTQVVAAALVLSRRESGLVWSAVAGFAMVIWIFAETALIAGSSWLQWLFFFTGTVQLANVLALTGVVAWLPREPLRRREGARRGRARVGS